MSSHDVAAGLASVRERIGAACDRAGRSQSSVRLVAVSKRQPAEAVRLAYAHGQRDFGENYLQELLNKAAQLGDLPELRWHMIGRLQSNKVKDLVRVGCSLSTLDSEALAQALAKRAAAAESSVEVLIQVNSAREAQKAGVEPAHLPQLAAAVRALPELELRGLMTIPKADASEAESRGYFRELRELAAGLGLPELSMGMSDDFELAIEQGATLVRVGTAIFGERR